MGENTHIEWTDHTFNPWRGCTHAVLADGASHPGCDHCYAEAMSKRNPKSLGVWGDDGVRVVGAPAYWQLPHRWNEAAEREGVRRRVFCASLADVFEDWTGAVRLANGRPLYACADCSHLGTGCVAVEPCPHCNCQEARQADLVDVRRYLFRTIDETPWLDWQLLTKRPQNIKSMWPKPVNAHSYGSLKQIQRQRELFRCYGKAGKYLELARPNVWLGASVSDQATADELVQKLLNCGELCPVRFLSVEPLIAPLDLGLNWAPINREDCKLHWVIVGGESGLHARPMHPDWVRRIRDDCREAGVPFFFKQWGEFAPAGQIPVDPRALVPGGKFGGVIDRDKPIKVGKRTAGRLLDGREWNEFPTSAMGAGAR